MFSTFRKLTGAAVVASLVFASSSAFASGSKMYSVTITNITKSILFTPILVASHRKNLSLFELGSPASEGLEGLIDIAEGGDVTLLTDTLEGISHVVEVKNAGALRAGESVTIEISAAHGARRITLASMMLPTNDGFIALNSFKAPKRGSVTYYSPGYDAGTEPNDELCISIPGPQCILEDVMGEGRSVIDNNAENYVHIHSGIHGTIGGLPYNVTANEFDWKNPVAKITITRIRGNDHDDDDDDD